MGLILKSAQPPWSLGILMMCVGVACLVVNDAIAKTLAPDYGPAQILFLRNLIALPIATIVAYRLGGRSALISHRPLAHLFRGGIWFGAAALFFTSLKYLGLAEATTLLFASPIFIVVIAAFLLKEHVGLRRWSAVLVGFFGVIVIIGPSSINFRPAAFLPLGGAILLAVLMISARWVDARESVWTLMLYLVGAGALFSSFLAPFMWTPIRATDLWLFFGIAIFGTAGITLITQAFRVAPAAVLAPLDYTALLWSVLLGWLIWREIPDLNTYVGALIIILSGFFLIRRDPQIKSVDIDETKAT